jgi:hypothetical protein
MDAVPENSDRCCQETTATADTAAIIPSQQPVLGNVSSSAASIATPNPSPSLAIEDVIDRFGALDYDDDDKYARPLLASLCRAFKKQKVGEEPSEVKRVMVSELTVFRNVIRKRMADTFFWHGQKDNQYCHVWVTQWIMARWFCAVKSAEELPEWYRACLEIANAEKQPPTTLALVEQLIHKIESFS